jgi:hypothetical protein
MNDGMEGGGVDQSNKIVIKWQLGKDLKSSSFWIVPASEGGFIFQNDSVYTYENNSGKYSTNKESGLVNEANNSIKEMYGIETDINNIVKDGKINQDYLEELNELLSKAQINKDVFGEEFGGNGYSPDIIPPELLNADYQEISVIVNDFLEKESVKEEVYNKFLTDVEASRDGSSSTQSFKFTVNAFIEALGDYAQSVGDSGANKPEAAKQIVSACDSAKAMLGYINLEPLEISFTSDAGVLTKLTLGIQSKSIYMSDSSINIAVEVGEVDKTDLANDEELKKIIESS